MPYRTGHRAGDEMLQSGHNTRSKRKLPASFGPKSPTQLGEWADLPEEEKALPEKNDWNEETPTAGKSGKRNRNTAPSDQSSMYARRKFRLRRRGFSASWESSSSDD